MKNLKKNRFSALGRLQYAEAIFYHNWAVFYRIFSKGYNLKMLDFLRKRKRNWIIIFFLRADYFELCRCFTALASQHDQTNVEVAQINGETISQREFALAYERAVERYRQMLKGSLTRR